MPLYECTLSRMSETPILAPFCRYPLEKLCHPIYTLIDDLIYDGF